MADHMLRNPQPHDLPLHTLFQYNASALRPLYPMPRPGNGEAANRAGRFAVAPIPRTSFEVALLQLLEMPNHPQAVPLSWLTSIARFVFDEDLTYVQFPLALKALDYLYRLEMIRRDEFRAMLTRLGLDESRSSSIQDQEQISSNVSQSKVDRLKNTMNDKSWKIEQLYTQVYIGLRRWVAHPHRDWTRWD